MTFSKKAAAAVVAVLTVVLNEWVGLGIPEETIENLVIVVAVYLGAQGVADHGKEAAKVQAGK